MVSKSRLILAFIAFSLIITPLASAETSTTANTATTNMYDIPSDEITRKNTFQAEEVQKNVETRMAEKLSTLNERMEERQQKREEKMAEFTSRLAAMTDERKKVIVERVNSRINTILENRISAWSQMLEKHSEILVRIKQKTSALKEEGVDVSGVEVQIAEAAVAIATAQSALEAQAAKDYTIVLSDESTVKADVTAAKEALKVDLKTLHTTIKAAHEAIRQAAQSLNEVKGSK